LNSNRRITTESERTSSWCGDVWPDLDSLPGGRLQSSAKRRSPEPAGESLTRALRVSVGGEDTEAQGLDSDGLEPGGEVLEQLSPEAVPLMIGVDVQGPNLTGGAGRGISGDGCRGDRDQGSAAVLCDQVARPCAAPVGVTVPEVPLPSSG